MKKIYRTKDNKEFDIEIDAIRHEKSLEKDTNINTVQMLILDLLKTVSMNGLDGEHIVSYLIKNKDKWIGVIPEIQDVTIRDIEDDMFHIDTILVKCETKEKAKEFLSLLKRNCSPEEISIENNIIRMWWD